jgi:glycosyltransferase involved in cell wall biosynthesis
MPHNDIRFWNKLEVPGNPKVSIGIAAYNRPDTLSCLLYCLKSQTYENWEAVVMHDGPNPRVRAAVAHIDDPRVRYFESEKRKGQFGHPNRPQTISLCTGDFIGLTNDDNYYAPVYFEAMLYALYSAGADFAYCDMIHSYWRYCYFVTQPRKNRCDLGAWIARSYLVKNTPWHDMDFAGDGTFIDDMVARCGYGRTIHVPMCLFTHN